MQLRRNKVDYCNGFAEYRPIQKIINRLSALSLHKSNIFTR